MYDPMTIWQTQNTEEFKMKVTELRITMLREQQKARLKVICAIMIALILCMLFGWRAIAAIQDGIVARLGYALLGLWSIYYAYQAHGWMWPRGQVSDAALNTTVRSYREELERKRDYEKHIWRRAGLTVCFLGVALILIPGFVKVFNHRASISNFIPFFALLTAWVATFIWKRNNDLNKLRKEIEELRGLEDAV
jgi:uncharacterized membrane protein YfcA